MARPVFSQQCRAGQFAHRVLGGTIREHDGVEFEDGHETADGNFDFRHGALGRGSTGHVAVGVGHD